MASVAAKIQLTQGATVGNPGEAIFGVTGANVVAANENNAGPVARWTWFLTDVPPGSALPIGTDGSDGTPFAPNQDGPTPTFTFLPDVRGGYALKLIVWDSTGRISATHKLVFGVKEESERFIPPFRAVATMLKFAGQLRGWAPYLEEWLRYADSILSGDDVTWGFKSFASSTGGRILTRRRLISTVNQTSTLYSHTLEDGRRTGIDAVIFASEASNAGRFNVSRTYQRIGGTPATLGATISNNPVGTNGGSPASGMAVDLDLSGNDARIRVTSTALLPTQWVGFIQITTSVS